MQKDFDPTCKYRLSLVPAFAVCSVCLDASVSVVSQGAGIRMPCSEVGWIIVFWHAWGGNIV